jgi:glycosyltransferase involved in cell wall biosynthesis
MQRVEALLVYIEPTPYVVGLIQRIAKSWKSKTEVLFIDANVSQAWDLRGEEPCGSYLPKNSVVAGRELASKLSTGRYELLHLAGWGHPVLLFALILAWWYRIPVFMESDTQLPISLPLWKRMVKRLVYPKLFRIPVRLLAGGSRQVEYFRYYGVNNDRIVKGQMTVDVTAIMRRSDAIREQGSKVTLRQQFGLCDRHIVFIYVGRLEAYKGIADLLDAFNELYKSHPDAALLIVGDGTQRAQVETAARTSRAVRYVGRLNSADVVVAYNCADVAILPSTREPWGLTVNEALAVGLPVIVSDRVGCADDLVQHGHSGLIFPAGSKERLRESMRYLLENSQTRAEMGKAGRYIIAPWTLEEQARITVNTWRDGIS